MNARLLGPILLAAFLNSCLSVKTESEKSVSPESVQKPMQQATTVGPLRVDCVVYKPKYLPLGTFLKRLSRGDFKSARRMAPFKYASSNVNDEALKALIKEGFVPVLVAVNNVSSQTVDAGGLIISLKDEAVTLAPIPNSALPTEFNSLSPKALAANTYNTTVVVASSLVVLAAAAGLDFLEYKMDHDKSDLHVKNVLESVSFLEDRAASTDLVGAQQPWTDMAVDNPVFNPVHKLTTIDYNGLLFSPKALAPGESARGIVFFKAKGIDWSSLQLVASLP